MSDPVAELDQVLPVVRALAEQDAKVVGTFYTALRAEVEHPYDVLELTREFLLARLDRDED